MTYRVHIIETIDYRKDYDEAEILEMAAKAGVSPDDFETVAEMLWSNEVQAVIEEDIQDSGEVRSVDFNAFEIREEEL